MPDLPQYPKLPVPVEAPEKKINVDKPATMTNDKKPVKFRPLRADKRGRMRKFKNDPRYVQFY